MHYSKQESDFGKVDEYRASDGRVSFFFYAFFCEDQPKEDMTECMEVVKAEVFL